MIKDPLYTSMLHAKYMLETFGPSVDTKTKHIEAMIAIGLSHGVAEKGYATVLELPRESGISFKQVGRSKNAR